MAALPPVAFDVLDVNSSGEFSVTASPAALVPPTSPDEFASAFSEVREVGRGRFGAAILVRHVASGGEYILRRTQFGSKGQLTAAAVGTEADALARMHHENIVRYYNAWMEGGGSRAQSRAASAIGIGMAANGALVTAPSAAVPTPLTRKMSGGVAGMADRGVDGPSAASWDLFDRSGDEDDGPSWGEDDGDDDDDDESDEESDADEENEDDGESSSPTKSSTTGASWLRRRASASQAVAHRKRYKRKLYIQMEYCKRTISDVLAEGPLPDEQVWRFLRQLLSGLQHVHSQGVTHRDLKPKNIFVDFGDNLKLGDFGLAAGDIADKPRSAEDDEEAPVPRGSAHAGGAASGRGGRRPVRGEG